MNRVLNAIQFKERLRSAEARYTANFQKEIERVRCKYAGNPPGIVPPEIDRSLEYHRCEYLINDFLCALNWRLGLSPKDGLPNLVPQSPIRSASRDTIRFLDYFGIERSDTDGDKPLMIVEAKSGKSKLPPIVHNEGVSHLISRGLSGDKIGCEWDEWLNTLRDYVCSVNDRSGKAPKRAVITNLEWLILFTDPEDAFLNTGNADPTKIFVYETYQDIVDRYNEIFNFLEYQYVLGELPHLTVAEIPFHACSDSIDSAMHGLKLLYSENKDFNGFSPIISIMPIIFILLKNGIWVCVESQKHDQVPVSMKKIAVHLKTIDTMAKKLLSDINERLGKKANIDSLLIHYKDEKRFEALPGVREKNYDAGYHSSEFFILTGKNTHYIKKTANARCMHHDWVKSNQAGCASNPGPITDRSTEYRSFFKSGEPYHCAHKETSDAKASQIRPDNRERCGSRSGRDSDPFCEIWQFERYLCCKVCAFEEVCIEAEVFNLPCTMEKGKRFVTKLSSIFRYWLSF